MQYASENNLSDYLAVANYVGDNSDSDEQLPVFLDNARAYLYLLSKNNNNKKAIQQLDVYIRSFGDDLTNDDNDLIKVIFYNSMTDYKVSDEYAYDIFKTALEISWFENLDFYFSPDCITQLEKEENQALAEQLTRNEIPLFFFDTSRLYVHKGIIFTEKSIIWKNIASDPIRINYNKIESITLIYERGFSLTGWELKLNNNDDLKIRLSKLDEDYFSPFMASILYFINYNRDNTTPLNLKIGERAQKVLNGSFWERHKEETIAVGIILTMIAGNELRKNESFRADMANLGDSIATRSSYFTSGIKKCGQSVTKAGKSSINKLTRPLKKFPIYKDGKLIGTFKLKELYVKTKRIKMPYIGSGKNATSKGFERNSIKYWKEYRKKFPSDLSKKNIRLIESGRSPKVDGQWLKSYSKHGSFKGETLEHHHLDHGAYTIPIPTTIHRGLNNSNIWHDSFLIIFDNDENYELQNIYAFA